MYRLLGLLLACVVSDMTQCRWAWSAEATQHPNIVLIVTDEHNFRTLGCYRRLLPVEQAEMWGPGTVVETPHLDRLAQEGSIGTRAYATSPVCSPCRAAMITGHYPHQAGVPANDLKLRTDLPTLATVLEASGYRTGFVGKWHLGGTGKPEWSPQINGGFQDTTYMFNRGHWKKLELTESGPRVAARNRRGEPTYDVAGADEKTFTTDFLTSRVIEFINRDDSRPFLIVLSIPDPHGPNTVRAPYDHMYDHLRFLPPRTYGRDDLPSPKWLGTGKNHAVFRGEQMSKYFGMVKCIDDNVGRLIQNLTSRGIFDSTVVMMTSDHGDLCYEHDRLNKGNPYEGSARVPMLIRYPKRIAPGTVVRQPMGTVDITPTLLGLAGIEHNETFQGSNLASQLMGESDQGRVIFLRNAGHKPSWVAAIDDRYKLVLSVNDRPWLFDAESDPDELLNFFGRPGTGAVSRRLAQALQDYGRRVEDPYLQEPNIAASLKMALQP